MREIRIKFSDRAMYTLAAIGVLILIGVGVYAYGGTQPSVVGHTLGEIQPPTPCNANQVLQWSGSAWQCADVSSGGGVETDPTVQANVKDGVSWGELEGTPPSSAPVITPDKAWISGVGWLNNGEIRGCRHTINPYEKGAIRINNGILETRYSSGSGASLSDTDWVRAHTALQNPSSLTGTYLDWTTGRLSLVDIGGLKKVECDLFTQGITNCPASFSYCEYITSW